MNTFKILCSCFIFLFITACDSQAQISPLNNVQEKTVSIKKATVDQVIIIEETAIESAAASRSRQPLNLSVDDVVLGDKTDDDVMVFNDVSGDEGNSTLFDGLSRNSADRRLKLSGQLLTDENEYETKDILKSVNGVQINVQVKFN